MLAYRVRFGSALYGGCNCALLRVTGIWFELSDLKNLKQKNSVQKNILYQSVISDDRGQRGIQSSHTGRFLPCARPCHMDKCVLPNTSCRRVRGQNEAAQHSLRKPTGELSQLNPKRGKLLHLGQADFADRCPMLSRTRAATAPFGMVWSQTISPRAQCQVSVKLSRAVFHPEGGPFPFRRFRAAPR